MIKRAFVKTIPVMVGYIVLGIGFGLLLKVNGYGVGWALAMSIFIYAGSLQYVGVSLLASGASMLSVALTSLVVNARHLFYGISMIGRYKDAGWRKPYLIHALSDETYSLLCTQEAGTENVNFCLLVSALDQCYWVLGSVIGSLIGTIFHFDGAGIDFSMTALFVAVFVEQWMETKEHRPALLGISISIVCLLLFGAERFILPSMLGILVVMSLVRKPLEQGEREHE